jgi:abscisic acid receptor (PYR/PYL family)
MMYQSQPQEVWRSSRDLISVRTDKEEPSSRLFGGSEGISKPGAVHYSQEEEEEGYGEWLQEVVGQYHSNGGGRECRCSSVVVQKVEAPVSVVWSLVRRFDEPQIYKNFVRTCFIRGEGDLKVKVGCFREIRVVSGLPAATSTERLDILDEEQHILSFSIVGGEHRLTNYRSITTLHERLINGKPGTIVIESYVVDVPQGNTKEDTRLFVDTIIKSNLQSLAHVSKHLISTRHCL